MNLLMKRYMLGLIGTLTVMTLSCRDKAKQNTVETAGGTQQSTARADTGNIGLDYQTYGLPEPYWDKALKRVFRRYGVNVRIVAGCVVDDSLINRVERNNRMVFGMLEQRLGAGAEQRIRSEIDSTANLQRRVESILDRQRMIVQKRAELDGSAGGRFLSIVPQITDSTGRLTVRIYVEQYRDGQLSSEFWKQFAIDTVRKSASAIQ